MKKEKIIFNKSYPLLIKQVIKMARRAITPTDKNQEVLDYMENILKEMDYLLKAGQIIKK